MPKKSVRKTLLILLAGLAAALAGAAAWLAWERRDAQAEPPEPLDGWREAYEAVIKSAGYASYIVIDLDQNGTPELVLFMPGRMGETCIFDHTRGIPDSAANCDPDTFYNRLIQMDVTKIVGDDFYWSKDQTRFKTFWHYGDSTGQSDVYHEYAYENGEAVILRHFECNAKLPAVAYPTEDELQWEYSWYHEHGGEYCEISEAEYQALTDDFFKDAIELRQQPPDAPLALDACWIKSPAG